MSFKRTKISHVRMTAISVGAAALLAIPLGAVLTSEDSGSSGEETRVVASAQPKGEVKPYVEIAPPPLEGAEVEAIVEGRARPMDPKLQRTQDMARKPTAALIEVAKSGSQIERLTAINVLWVRGERSRVEELAQGDRVLRPKVEALKRAGR